MNPTEKSITLALQGGGSHGAFTWGALRRLLEVPDRSIEAVSGCSSGAMNAVLLAQDLMDGGRAGAQSALARFWRRVGADFGAMFGYALCPPQWAASVSPVAPVRDAFLRMTRDLSPYLFNPLGHNPMRQVLGSLADFDRLRDHSPLQLFVGATQVRTGKLRIFTTTDLSTDVVLASACLPSLHHAVIIDGEAYWDGGFSGNPPLFPLLFECRASDLLVTIIQPLQRTGLPPSAEEIRTRTLELSFNSTFVILVEDYV